MKTRIIQTRFWDDDFISGCNLYTCHLYIYLLTSQYINISGIFQLPLRKIVFESKLTEKQLGTAIEELSQAGKADFYKGWVYIRNAFKNNNYVRSEDNQKAYEKEIALVPQEVKEYFDSSVNSTADSSVGVLPTVPINKKQETINKKQERESIYLEVISHYNSTFDKQTKSYKAWKSNCDFWLETYSLEDIKQAITNCRLYGWWAKDPSIELFFRVKSKSGEPVDYIDQLLNSREALRARESDDPLVRTARKALGYDK